MRRSPDASIAIVMLAACACAAPVEQPAPSSATALTHETLTPARAPASPALWLVHPEDARGESVSGAADREEVVYVLESGELRSIWRGPVPVPQPLARPQAGVLIAQHADQVVRLDLQGDARPLLDSDRPTAFAGLWRAKALVLEQQGPPRSLGYELGAGEDGKTVVMDYDAPRDRLYLCDPSGGAEPRRLGEGLELARVLDVDARGGAIWAITPGEQSALVRLSPDGSVQRVVSLDPRWIAAQTTWAFSPDEQHLALGGLHADHDFHGERELIVVDVGQGAIAYEHARVEMTTLALDSATPALALEWLDTEHLAYGGGTPTRVAHVGKGRVPLTAEMRRRLEPTPEGLRRLGFFDLQHGQAFFHDAQAPVADVLDHSEVQVRDMAVSPAGRWVAYVDPKRNDDTYLVDGERRSSDVLIRGWSYGLTWLAVAPQ